MSRYIDAEDVKLLLWGYTNGDVDLLKKIDTIESKDVAPVIHAQWINYNGEPVKLDSNGSPKDSCWCSHCHEWLVTSDEYTSVNKYRGRYCPNCGAKMD